MLSKPAPRLQVRPGKHLHCDFSGMRRCRATPVQIRHAGAQSNSTPPGNSLVRAQDFSRAVGRKTHIRSYWIENMRGAVSEVKARKKDSHITRGTVIRHTTTLAKDLIRSRSRRSRRARAGFTCDSFLLYLTARAISDNRHGLLRQRASARAAETLSAVEPQT